MEHARDACAVGVGFHIIGDGKDFFDIDPIELIDRENVATNEFQGGTPLGAVTSQRLLVLSTCYSNLWLRKSSRADRRLRNCRRRGTCAGMILLSSTIQSINLQPLGIMDFTVNRNAHGRQIDSFSAYLHLDFSDNTDFHTVFIRAPKIKRVGSNFKILATYKKEPVMITDGRHFVTTFHPEIGTDIRIHSYIMEQFNA